MRLLTRVKGLVFSVKRLVLVFILLLASCFLLLAGAKPVNAQSPSVTPPIQTQNEYLTPNTNPDVPKNLHTWTQNVMIEVMSALTCQLAGVDPTEKNLACLGIDSKTGKIGYVENGGGVLGFLQKGIMIAYTPPFHAGDYIKYLSQNFGVVKSSYAQGVGFTSLSPLIQLWTIFRNLTYVFAVIVFILIGVGIMLRVKIDPRTVMTIQNQIPKIIIALIIITFSFAIVGFLIDLMFISIYFIWGLFGSVSGVAVSLSPNNIQHQTVLTVADNVGIFQIAHNVGLSGKDTLNNFLGVDQRGGIISLDNITGAFNSLFSFNSWENFDIVNRIYDWVSLMIGLKTAAAAATVSPQFLGISIPGTVVGLSMGFAVFQGLEFFLRDLLPYLIIFLIVIIAIIITLFRVLFMLLRAYVTILLDVIFAPIWIIGGLMPGTTSVGVGPWLRDVAANLAVFPAVYIMFILSQVVGHAIGEGNVTNLFSPPLLGNPLAANFLGSIVSLGLILMTPEAAKMTKAAFKAPKLDLGGLGFATGAAAGIIATPFRKFASSQFGKNPYTGQWRTGSKVVNRELQNVVGGTSVGKSVSTMKSRFRNKYDPTKLTKEDRENLENLRRQGVVTPQPPSGPQGGVRGGIQRGLNRAGQRLGGLFNQPTTGPEWGKTPPQPTADTNPPDQAAADEATRVANARNVTPPNTDDNSGTGA